MKHQHDVNVFVWNMSEDIWPFLSAITTKQLKEYETVENDLYADREFFNFPHLDVSLFFSPHDVSDSFRGWVASIVGTQPVTVLTPKKNTSAMSEDILQDTALVRTLLSGLKPSNRLIIRSYSATPQFLELVYFLRKKGIEVIAPESPIPEGAWVSNYFGSKSGIRQVIQQHLIPKQLCKLAYGYIAHTIVEAASLAAWLYITHHGVVLKTNKAHSGSGVLIFRTGSLPKEYQACSQQLLNILSKDEYWKRFPIIIEECIDLDESVLGGNPNIEFRVMENGKPHYLYTCGMRVDDSGVFGGVEIGNIGLRPSLEHKLKKCGIALGSLYGQAGYRGYFDVDCLYSTNNNLYIAESNIRRTGGTYVYELATRLFGKRGYMKKYFASTTHTFSTKAELFQTTLRRLDPILYSHKKQEGIIITAENLLTVGRLMYVVVADTKERAVLIEQEMQKYLSV